MMGYRVAKACALAVDPPLTPLAHVVLNRMAWAVLDSSQDDRPAATYWGGWEWLGLPFRAGRDTNAVRRLVTRALTELTTKGYVKTMGVAHRGQRQTYLITVSY